MKKVLAILLALSTIGCHNVIIMSGGGFKPVMIPLTPELQCVAVAMQLLTPAQQHAAIQECETQEEGREHGQKTSEKANGSSTAKQTPASTEEAKH